MRTPDRTPLPGPSRAAERRTILAAYAGFVLIGWATVLVPALVLDVKATFNQSDSGIGAFFFVLALANMTGPVGGGLVTERIGARRTLPAGAVLLGLGLAGLALAPTWPLFLLAALPVGVGSGIIDGGMNGVVLALAPDRRSTALSRLHLFFALGASLGPVVIGMLAGAGAEWQAIVLGSALGSGALAVVLAASPLPSGRPGSAVTAAPASAPVIRRSLLPLVILSIAIGASVASEIGVSNWVVRFLEGAPGGIPTATLGAFWAGIALGRLVASRISDRFDPAAYGAACALGASVALLGAIVIPAVALAAPLFAFTGFLLGPVYPMVMAIAGRHYPDRLAAVTGWLATAAVIGALVYPPLVGVISDTVGIAAGMVGLAVLGMVSGIALLALAMTSGERGAGRPMAVAGDPSTRSDESMSS